MTQTLNEALDEAQDTRGVGFLAFVLVTLLVGGGLLGFGVAMLTVKAPAQVTVPMPLPEWCTDGRAP